MALINCPQCGNKISDKAGSCPKCGYNFKSEIAYKDILTGTEKSSWYLFKISMVGFLVSSIFLIIGTFDFLTFQELFGPARIISGFSKILLFMSLCLIVKNGFTKVVLWLIWLYCCIGVILPYLVTLGDTTFLTISFIAVNYIFVLYFVAKCKSTVRATMVFF